MLTAGNVTAPIGHTRGLPVPSKPVAIRPIQRRNTSPFTSTAPSGPDPDAIARLERLGLVTIQAAVVDDKPVKVVTRARGRRNRKDRPTRGTGTVRRLDLDAKALAAEYEAGATLAQLAATHGASQEAIRARLRAQQVTMRKHTDRSGVSTETIVQLHQAGMNLKQIAAEVGLSDVTIGNRLRSAGIYIGRGHTAVFDEDKALTMAREGASAYAISKAVGVCRRTVIDRLATHGVTFEDTRRAHTDIDRLLELGREGWTITRIADELEVSERTVSNHLHRHGITPPDGRASNCNTPRHDITADTLAADYRAGFSVNEIAAKHKVSRATVRRRLSTVEGLEWRDDRKGLNGGKNRTPDDVTDRIVELYKAGRHAKEIALEVGLPHSTVYGVLRRTGIDMRPMGASHRGRPGVDHAAALKELMRANGVSTADVRAWANETGRDIPKTGLPSRQLLEDYLLNRGREVAS